MASLSEEQKMPQTTRTLLRVCAQQLSHTGRFVVGFEECTMSLGEIQRKSILSASTIKDVMQVYKEVDMLVQKHRESSYRVGSNRIDLQDEFYS